jgi:hypothetical protein
LPEASGLVVVDITERAAIVAGLPEEVFAERAAPGAASGVGL